MASEDSDFFDDYDGLTTDADVEEHDDDDIEIEIVDDTPEEDRGREALPPEEESEYSHDDEIANVSKRVQKRINETTKRYHDERRAKEAFARQNEEAIKFAQAVIEENKRLKQTVEWGEKALVEQAQYKLAIEQAIAEARFARAHESGDTAELVAAQKELTKVGREIDQLNQYVPQAPQLQVPQNPVYTPQQQVKPRDEKAEAWAARNPWFQKDGEMTSLAYGIHDKLVTQNVVVGSDDYYQQIDAEMRHRFPEKFGTPQKRKPSVVAAATRTSPSKKVQLTRSQVAIAERFNIPLAEYARQAQILKNKGQ